MIKVVLFVLLCFSASINARGKLVIDNDAGGDDAMAIFLALLYEKYFDGPEIIALTTGNGNTNEDNVCRNNQRILKDIQRQDNDMMNRIYFQAGLGAKEKHRVFQLPLFLVQSVKVPIYRGSKSSIVNTPKVDDYFGIDGLGDVDEVIDNLVPAQDESAVNALISLSKKHPGELTVVTIGTQTNVAMAIKMDPEFLGRLAHLYIGAGHIHSEKNPDPEFNAHMDVEAYHIIMQHATPDKVSVFPFSQTREYLNFTKEWRLDVLGAIDTEIMRRVNLYERISIPKNEEWAELDASVVAAAINPDLVEEYKYSKNNIIICGDERAITTHELVEKDQANVRVVYKVKTEEYKNFLLDVFSAELETKKS